MHPHIHIGGLELSSWRIVVLAGVLLCWALFLPRAKRLGYSRSSILFLLVLALPVGTVGGHLVNALIPAVFGLGWAAPASGLTVIGSIVSVLGFSLLYIKYVIKTDAMPLLDAVAFTFPLSIMIGRTGCLLSGCCYGKLASDQVRNSLLSVFTVRTDLYAPTSQAWQVLRDWPQGSLIWNLPLMLMLNALFVLITVETLYRNRERWRLQPGTVMAAACTQYAGGRFFMEFLRRDDLSVGAVFNPWQLAIGILFFVSLTWLCVSLVRRSRTLSRCS
ncbi:MAG: prolipoprotein diacylglyceryl transferase family protein [Nitrospirota bacterium]